MVETNVQPCPERPNTVASGPRTPHARAGASPSAPALRWHLRSRYCSSDWSLRSSPPPMSSSWSPTVGPGPRRRWSIAQPGLVHQQHFIEVVQGCGVVPLPLLPGQRAAGRMATTTPRGSAAGRVRTTRPCATFALSALHWRTSTLLGCTPRPAIRPARDHWRSVARGRARSHGRSLLALATPRAHVSSAAASLSMLGPVLARVAARRAARLRGEGATRRPTELVAVDGACDQEPRSGAVLVAERSAGPRGQTAAAVRRGTPYRDRHRDVRITTSRCSTPASPSRMP